MYAMPIQKDSLLPQHNTIETRVVKWKRMEMGMVTAYTFLAKKWFNATQTRSRSNSSFERDANEWHGMVIQFMCSIVIK